MNLSKKISDFKDTLKSCPFGFNLGEIINCLENFCYDADNLQNKLDDANDKIYDLEKEVEFLEDKVRGLRSELEDLVVEEK